MACCVGGGSATSSSSLRGSTESELSTGWCKKGPRYFGEPKAASDEEARGSRGGRGPMEKSRDSMSACEAVNQCVLCCQHCTAGGESHLSSGRESREN